MADPREWGPVMENLRGALMMTLAMAAFAIEDALVKNLTGGMAPGQIIAVIGAGGTLILAAWLKSRGVPLFLPELRERAPMIRLGFEVFGTACYTSSLALIPLTTASAVIQATPLVVALGGAVFLGQAVGWRRWGAILLGLAGVLLILRPTGDSFQMATLLAFGGMMGLAGRDIATRAIGGQLSGVHLSLVAFLALIPAGILMAVFSGQGLVVPSARDAALLGVCVGFGLGGYLAIVAATRAGDVAFTSSFRYFRMVFAVIIGFFVFAERPDLPTLIGTAIVIGAGLFILMRERRTRRFTPGT